MYFIYARSIHCSDQYIHGSVINFVVDFHLPTHCLRRLLVEHWHLIEKSPLLSRLFPNRPTVAFRTHNSLNKQQDQRTQISFSLELSPSALVSLNEHPIPWLRSIHLLQPCHLWSSSGRLSCQYSFVLRWRLCSLFVSQNILCTDQYIHGSVINSW